MDRCEILDGRCPKISPSCCVPSSPRGGLPIFIVWKFRENEVVGVFFEGTRDGALKVAGLSE
jgi:hypothetical protein